MTKYREILRMAKERGLSWHKIKEEALGESQVRAQTIRQ